MKRPVRRVGLTTDQLRDTFFERRRDPSKGVGLTKEQLRQQLQTWNVPSNPIPKRAELNPEQIIAEVEHARGTQRGTAIHAFMGTIVAYAERNAAESPELRTELDRYLHTERAESESPKQQAERDARLFKAYQRHVLEKRRQSGL